MSLGLYMDEHVPRAITLALRLRGIDVLTTQEDGAEGRPDSDMIERATELNRVVFTQDVDFLREAAARHHTCSLVSDLELLAKMARPDELRSRVEYLPLR